jgi:hypothetical protein
MPSKDCLRAQYLRHKHRRHTPCLRCTCWTASAVPARWQEHAEARPAHFMLALKLAADSGARRCSRARRAGGATAATQARPPGRRRARARGRNPPRRQGRRRPCRRRAPGAPCPPAQCTACSRAAAAPAARRRPGWRAAAGCPRAAPPAARRGAAAPHGCRRAASRMQLFNYRDTQLQPRVHASAQPRARASRHTIHRADAVVGTAVRAAGDPCMARWRAPRLHPTHPSFTRRCASPAAVVARGAPRSGLTDRRTAGTLCGGLRRARRRELSLRPAPGPPPRLEQALHAPAVVAQVLAVEALARVRRVCAQRHGRELHGHAESPQQVREVDRPHAARARRARCSGRRGVRCAAARPPPACQNRRPRLRAGPTKRPAGMLHAPPHLAVSGHRQRLRCALLLRTSYATKQRASVCALTRAAGPAQSFSRKHMHDCRPGQAAAGPRRRETGWAGRRRAWWWRTGRAAPAGWGCGRPPRAAPSARTPARSPWRSRHIITALARQAASCEQLCGAASGCRFGTPST